MPRLTDATLPSYRLHRQSGQAIVTLNGRDCLLGKAGSAASKAEYNRRIAEWLAAGRQCPVAKADLTVAELIARYKVHVEAYYRHADGTPTGEAASIQKALRPLRKLYGTLSAAEFSPLKLKAVRELMVNPGAGQEGWARRHINQSVGRIRRCFKWAVENELVPADTCHALAAVAPLKAGRCDARETDPIRSVSDAYVDAVLPYVGPQVRAMIELQLLTGARPGELCIMRTIDVDTSDKVWLYTPSAHKTQHHGHTRSIRLGPKAQDILRPFLKADTQAYIFSPAESEAARHGAAHAARKTPLSCGNRPGSNRKRKRNRAPLDRYDVASYRRAITRACDAAFPPADELVRIKVAGRGRKAKAIRWETEAEWQTRLGPAKWAELQTWRAQHHWHPHQLRHSAATKIRRAYGLEMARIILGHKNVQITELYAEADTAKAAMVMSDIG